MLGCKTTNKTNVHNQQQQQQQQQNVHNHHQQQQNVHNHQQQQNVHNQQQQKPIHNNYNKNPHTSTHKNKNTWGQLGSHKTEADLGFDVLAAGGCGAPVQARPDQTHWIHALTSKFTGLISRVSYNKSLPAQPIN